MLPRYPTINILITYLKDQDKNSKIHDLSKSY